MAAQGDDVGSAFGGPVHAGLLGALDDDRLDGDIEAIITAARRYLLDSVKADELDKKLGYFQHCVRDAPPPSQEVSAAFVISQCTAPNSPGRPTDCGGGAIRTLALPAATSVLTDITPRRKMFIATS